MWFQVWQICRWHGTLDSRLQTRSGDAPGNINVLRPKPRRLARHNRSGTDNFSQSGTAKCVEITPYHKSDSLLVQWAGTICRPFFLTTPLFGLDLFWQRYQSNDGVFINFIFNCAIIYVDAGKCLSYQP